MRNILKVIYQLVIIAGMIFTGNNTIVLKDLGEKVETLSPISHRVETELKTPRITTHSEININ